MLIVKNLRKEFKKVIAVDNLSFNVQPGRIFGLLGPNGAGKTTTIRTILNIIKPDSGEIFVNNQPVTSALYNKLGYLPEERGLYRKNKVINVLLYLAALKGMRRYDAYEAAEMWLKKLDIPGYKNKKIEELSKGNQQKIQFISAVLHNPELIILDEPFAGFDPINQEIVKDLLLSLSNEGKIIIMSTHQMDTTEKLCADILLMNNGREVLSGSISEIKKKFGSNIIKVEFEGNADALHSLQNVTFADIQNHSAEFQVDNISPSEFLKILVERISIRHFSIIEPSLHNIFLETVKKEKV